MLGTQNLDLFLLAAISLNLLPGADTLYIIARSIAQGRKAGIVSVLGISTGSLLHTTAATFGLSAILATSAIALLVWELNLLPNKRNKLLVLLLLESETEIYT